MTHRPHNPSRHRGSASPCRHQALTLIEVLMVVAIIGIAGAVVVPSLLQAGAMQIQAAGRMVIADLLFAQNEAVARAQPVRVVFEPDVNRYYLTDGAGNPVPTSWRTGGDNSANYVVDLSRDRRFDGVRIDAAPFGDGTTVEFDALGAPSDGGNIDLVTGTVRYRIQVAAFTGRVTIQQIVP